MAKKKDPFETFRQATLGGVSPFDQALSEKPTPKVDDDPRRPIRPQDVQKAAPAPEVKQSKNEGRELVSFHIEKDIKKKLGFIKFNTGKSFNDLYCEAIEDLLRKYDQL